MLLSMAKLQCGQALESVHAKRWQTPKDVYAQTQEAVLYLKNTRHAPEKIILLYTDALYLNNTSPAMGLMEKYQALTLEHRRSMRKLFADDVDKLSVTEMLWGELVQGQPDYQGPRAKLKQFYENHAAFRSAVHHDNVKRTAYSDTLTPEDMFVLEEAGLFDALAKGQISSEKIDIEHDLVIAYPGPVLQSLQAIQEHKLRLFKSHSLRKGDRAYKTLCLDLSLQDQPAEKEIYTFQPHPAKLKNQFI